MLLHADGAQDLLRLQVAESQAPAGMTLEFICELEIVAFWHDLAHSGTFWHSHLTRFMASALACAAITSSVGIASSQKMTNNVLA